MFSPPVNENVQRLFNGECVHHHDRSMPHPEVSTEAMSSDGVREQPFQHGGGQAQVRMKAHMAHQTC